MINRLIDRKMNPVLIVPVKQEYKINEEKIKNNIIFNILSIKTSR